MHAYILSNDAYVVFMVYSSHLSLSINVVSLKLTIVIPDFVLNTLKFHFFTIKKNSFKGACVKIPITCIMFASRAQ